MTETPPPVVETGDVADNASLVLDELAATLKQLDPQEIAELAAYVNAANRVFVVGAGRSGLALRMAAMRLMHLGYQVYVAGDTTTPAIGPDDLLIAASGSGTTSGVVRAAETASKAGAAVVSLTASPDSPLGASSNLTVTVPAAKKTDHGTSVSSQYAGSLFEQTVLITTEVLFQSLWKARGEAAEELWKRHANIE